MSSGILGADLLFQLVAEAKAAEGMVVRWLADRPAGGHVLGLSADDDTRVAVRVLFVAAPKRGRVQVCAPEHPPKKKLAESAFVRAARPLLDGARLTALHVERGDRVVRAQFLGQDGAKRALVAELFGAAQNLVLVDGNSIVRAAEHARHGARSIQIGKPYVPPANAPARVDGAPPAVTHELAPAAPSPFAAAFPLAAAVDAWLEPEDRAAAFLAAKANVLARAKDKLARETKGIEHARADQTEGATAARTRQIADSLMAQFHVLRRGLSTIEVDDLFGGGRLTVALDPALDPHKNVDTYYTRARKLERKATSAAARLLELEPRVAAIARTVAAIEALGADDADQLEAFQHEFASPVRGGRTTGAAPTGTPGTRKRETRDALAGLRRFRTRGGTEVLVGRTDRDNDRLTTRVARGNDVWLHLAHEPGSHVVLRVERGKTASLDDLTDAALLAAHYSKRRGAARCEITWTPKKYVRKPKGARPGAVLVERSKTLLVQLDPTRLKSLLASSATPHADD